MNGQLMDVLSQYNESQFKSELKIDALRTNVVGWLSSYKQKFPNNSEVGKG